MTFLHEAPAVPSLKSSLAMEFAESVEFIYGLWSSGRSPAAKSNWVYSRPRTA